MTRTNPTKVFNELMKTKEINTYIIHPIKGILIEQYPND